jgi:hypothetical protein
VSQIVVPPEIRTPLTGAERSSTSFGNGPAIHTPLTLGDWLDRKQAKRTNERQSIESLYVQAVSFLERHLRERLGIANGEEVVLGFDPYRTRPWSPDPLLKQLTPLPRSSGLARNEPAHGLPNSIALRDLYPEFKGSGSMKTILLFEDPVRKVDEGWSSVATITVEYMHDRWCVTSVLVWGGANTTQSAASDLFLPKYRVAGVDFRNHPAYKNALDIDYPAPMRNILK